MRISRIKLAGFKSFVDPTTLHLSQNLTGIVGPNGCGKSNVIDAVLWVMGEISAKHLRGDSMADVIFNGSSTRKPVGQATVEVVFDNASHSFGGPYASYSEVAVKRQLSRDGTSLYLLNGSRCRRRDIRDLFLGTGVGTRSYAVIEQGMISRVVEAKPEELRGFLEEAAGISRYRERRRETESRLQQARDNLARLCDVRAEIDAQLTRVQQQARAAERYRRLKEEERRVKAELLALAWRGLERQSQAHGKVTEGQLLALEAATTELRECELQIEQLRGQHEAATARFNAAQADYYAVGAEVARLEQAIEHTRERQRAIAEETARIAEELAGAERETEADQTEINRLRELLVGEEAAAGQVQEEERLAAHRLSGCESEMRDWQGRWEECSSKLTELSRSETAEMVHLEHLARQLAAGEEGTVRAGVALDELAAAVVPDVLTQLGGRLAELRENRARAQARRAELQAEICERRAQIDQAETDLHGLQDRHRDLVARCTSLEVLQDHAGGGDQNATRAWIAAQGEPDPTRLVHGLVVEPGFETALEVVLADMVNAFYINDIGSIANVIRSFDHGRLALLERGAPVPEAAATGTSLPPLASKLLGHSPVASLLYGVYVARDLVEALAVRATLQPGESVVTASGVWLGPGWLRYPCAPDAGVLRRQQEIERLAADARDLEQALAGQAGRLERWRSELAAIERDDRSSEAESSELRERIAQTQSEIAAREAAEGQLRERQAAIHAELELLRARATADRAELLAARERLGAVQAALQALARERERLAAERARLHSGLERAREAWQDARERAHRVALRMEGARAQCASLEEALRRNRERIEALTARRAELDAALDGGEQPLAELQATLDQALAAHLRADDALGEARAGLASIDAAVRTHEQRRGGHERAIASHRDELERSRVLGENLRVRLEAQQELIEETGHALDTVLGSLPEEADAKHREERLLALEQKVQRLGPINLAALEEVQGLSERKGYLDRQDADLSEALATLEEAIRRIDRETRERFKDTFERVDAGLRGMFPRLFGGGHARLVLGGEDLLSGGVTLMAQPPGKRNSTIHLLSGGEKALTALALVFTIFELNPAPFCLLDEVDAPLDDANVGHLGEMLRSMSEAVQFLFVTHNKITMEIADRLIGVTMQEAGVSRLVAVDIDEAVRLAATG